MEDPTMLVIHKPTGEERLINVDRFNPEIHEEVEKREVTHSLEDMKRHELMKIASELGKKPNFSMTKVDLIKLIQKQGLQEKLEELSDSGEIILDQTKSVTQISPANHLRER